MIRTGQEYRDSIRDGRRIWINGERVADVTTHPQFKPLVDIRARIFDMQHEEAHRDLMTVTQDGERNALGSALPYSLDTYILRRITPRLYAIITSFGPVIAAIFGALVLGESFTIVEVVAIVVVSAAAGIALATQRDRSVSDLEATATTIP